MNDAVNAVGIVTACPICGQALRDLERVEARHTPASVPDYVKGYGIARSYTIAECARGHRYEASGGKGPMGWRELRSGSPHPSTLWTWPRDASS